MRKHRAGHSNPGFTGSTTTMTQRNVFALLVLSVFSYLTAFLVFRSSEPAVWIPSSLSVRTIPSVNSDVPGQKEGSHFIKTVKLGMRVTTMHHKRNYSLSSEVSARFPYFYKQTSTHPNVRFRLKPSIHFNHSLSGHFNNSRLILFYNPPAWFDRSVCSTGVNRCPIKSCLCSYDHKDLSQADAVILDAVDLRVPTPPNKTENQVWIFFGQEAPVHYHNPHYRSVEYRRMFNWTMTYRLDADIPIPYGALVRHNVTSSKNYTAIALQKSKSAVWLVSNCDTRSGREHYVRELLQYVSVDTYGQCGNTCSSPDCLAEVEKKYRFYLAFENSLCDDYITEKLFKIYTPDIHLVPIVRGGADYESMIPAGTYINTASFASPKHLAKYLLYLERNVTAYAEILRQKDRYILRGHRQNAYSAFCDICMKMHHQNISFNYYFDAVKWLEQDVCRTPRDLKTVPNFKPRIT